MKNIFFLLFPVMILLNSCTKPRPDKPVFETNPQYTNGYVLFFGNYYKYAGIDNNILSMSLFTEGITVEDGALRGTGQYLNIEELYLAPLDTLMPAGQYTINDTRQPMTALSGQIPKEYPYMIIGACIYYVENGTITNMMPLTGNSFNVHSITEEEYEISFDFVTSDNMTITGNLKGELPHYDARQREPESLQIYGILKRDLKKL